MTSSDLVDGPVAKYVVRTCAACGGLELSKMVAAPESDSADQARPVWLDQLELYGALVVCGLGLATNLLLVVLLAASPLRRRTSCVYVIVLGAADFLLCLTLLLRELNARWRCYITSTSGLVALLLLHLTSQFFSVFLVVIIAVDRFILICLPLKRWITESRKICRRTIAATLACSFALSFMAFFHVVRVDDRGQHVEHVPDHLAAALRYSHYVLEFGVDVIGTTLAVLIFTTVTLHRLTVARQRRRRLLLASIPGTTVSGDHKERCLTRVALAICVLFVVLRVPHMITWLTEDCVLHYHGIVPLSLAVTDKVAFLLRLLNHSINLFLYLTNSSSCMRRLKSLCFYYQETPVHDSKSYSLQSINHI